MNRVKLAVVIGANGAGKAIWTRRHRQRLPPAFYNADSLAEGLGDANSPESQARARALVDREIVNDRRDEALLRLDVRNRVISEEEAMGVFPG